MELFNECRNWRMKCISTFFSQKILSFNCEIKSKKGNRYTKAMEVNVLVNPNDKNLADECDCSEIVMQEWENEYIAVDGTAFIDMKGNVPILKIWAKNISKVEK